MITVVGANAETDGFATGVLSTAAMGMVEALSQGEDGRTLRLSEALANAVASGMIGLSIGW